MKSKEGEGSTFAICIELHDVKEERLIENDLRLNTSEMLNCVDDLHTSSIEGIGAKLNKYDASSATKRFNSIRELDHEESKRHSSFPETINTFK